MRAFSTRRTRRRSRCPGWRGGSRAGASSGTLRGGGCFNVLGRGWKGPALERGADRFEERREDDVAAVVRDAFHEPFRRRVVRQAFVAQLLVVGRRGGGVVRAELAGEGAD